MTRNLYEPNQETRISQNRYRIKDTRQKPEAFAWVTPIDEGGTIPVTDPDYTPELINSVVQPTGDLESFSFRLNADGRIQTKGFLDVSAVTSGVVAWVMPGTTGGEVDFIPPTTGNDGFALRVSTTGDATGIVPATGYIDATTGDVSVTWAGGGFDGFPRAVLAGGATDMAANTPMPIRWNYAARYNDPNGDYFDWTITDSGDTGNDRFELELVKNVTNVGGWYQLECFIGWDNLVVGYAVLKINIWNGSSIQTLPMVDTRLWDANAPTDLFSHVVGQVDTRPGWYGDGGWFVRPTVYHTDGGGTRGFSGYWLKAMYLGETGNFANWVEDFI